MNRLKVFLKYPHKKPIFKMIKEVLILMLKKKEIPFYYFKYLYRKNVFNYLDYTSLKEQVLLVNHPSLHNPEYGALIGNKLYFSLFCEKTVINTPKLLGYNFKSNFSYNHKIIQVLTKDRLISYFQHFFDNNIAGIFFRPLSDYGGRGCFKITKADFKVNIDTIYKRLKQGDFVHTEVIEQHPEVNKIYRKSINTLRLISLITFEGKTEIISAFMRFGKGGNVVDNASSGGLFVGINIEDGTLKSTGHYLPEYGGREIIKHPDSGFKFEGFKIPYFTEVCETVINAVKVIPDRLIGWDIAITPSGPVIIEANAEPHIPISNIAYGGLLKNKHVKALMEELKASK